MKRYNNVRNELKDLAISILSHGPSCSFGMIVQEKLNQVNTRWKHLCDKLGLTFKEAEETLFLLKLLQEMLGQLNRWLNNVHEKIKGVELNTCSFDAMKRSIKNIDVSQGSSFYFETNVLHSV
jgi:hypothetical protein